MTEAIRDYVRGLSILAALMLVSLAVVFNPAPWSALGQAEQTQKTEKLTPPTIDLSQFDIPEGWAPGNGTRIVVPRVPTTET